MELETILARTREVAQSTAAELAEYTDRERAWPEKALRELQAAGLGGLVVSRENGGLGHGLLAVAQVCEILAQQCASTALCFGMHCAGTAVIQAKATADQRVRFLDPICRGEHLTTLALSEPGTGGEFYFPQCELDLHTPQEYRVTGRKCFVTNGGHADSYVISAVSADPDTPVGEFSCLVVDGRAPGLVWGPEWDGLGMRGNSSRELELRDVVISRDNLLGREGDQIWYVFNVVAPFFLMSMAGSYLGISTAVLQDTRAYLGSRRHRHSGLSLAQMQMPQHRLGTLWATVERTRRLVYFAGEEADRDGPDALPALLSVKAEVAECAVFAVNEALTLQGGRAYQKSPGLDRRLRDARAAHVMSPLTDLLRLWTGRALLDQPILD